MQLRGGRLPALARRAAGRRAAGRLPGRRAAGPRLDPVALIDGCPPPAHPMDACARRSASWRTSTRTADERSPRGQPGQGAGPAARPCPRSSPTTTAAVAPGPLVGAARRPRLRGQLPVHAFGEEPSRRRRRVRRVADPVRRARVQRLDVHRPRGHLDRSRTCIRRSSGPSGPSRARCTAGPTRRVMDLLRRDRPAARRGPGMGLATPWPASRRSWASATASTRPATRGCRP